MESTTYQLEFVRRLREAHATGGQGSLVPALVDLLHLSPSAIRNRLSGKTPFTLADLTRLCHTYAIHFHIDRRVLSGTLQGPAAMYAELDSLVRSDDALFYASSELPVFYLFRYPSLSALKAHVWAHRPRPDVGVDLPPLQPLPEPERERLGELGTLYRSVARVEIWRTDMLGTLLTQLDYLRQFDCLGAEGGIAYATLVAEIDRLTRELRELVKRKDGPLMVYLNDFHNPSNFALRSGGTERLYLPVTDLALRYHDRPELYAEQLAGWHDQLAYCQPVGPTDGRLRKHFFDQLRHEQRYRLKER